MLTSLDAAAVRRWVASCCDELAARRDEIDGLNVFPVADQDTGSNLLATMRAGLDAVLRDGGGDGAAAGPAAALARGAVRGARGNSGVIVSQVLRGLAESLADGPEQGGSARGGAALREGLRRADELATAAVAQPVAGTVLTVLQAAARAAAAARSDDLCAVASAAADAATRALADTPRQLAVLARAGVVDAGGQGLVLLLDALLTVVTEHPGGRRPAAAPGAARPAMTLQAQREAGSTEYEYEVMYLLDSAAEAGVATLRGELGGLGDCVAVVGSGQLTQGDAAPVWNVHVHCSDVGAAIEAGMRVGRPHRITVLRFADQVGAGHTDVGRTDTGRTDAGRQQDRFVTGHAVLALVAGAGVAELLRGEGALVVPPGCGRTELLAVLTGTRARQVTVLAGPGPDSRAAQAAAAHVRRSGQDVVVVPTPSAVQMIAAMAVHLGDRRAADDRVAMTEAVVATRYGELCATAEQALTRVGRCRPGDLLGIVGDQVVLIAREPPAAARGLVDRMLASGAELVTVLLGRQAPDGLGDLLGEHLRAEYPEVEAVVYDGGQPDTVLSVGVD